MADNSTNDFELPEESNPLVKPTFGLAILMFVCATTTTWDRHRTVLSNLREEWWLPSLFVVAFVLTFRTNSVRVVGSQLVITKKLWFLQKRSTWPLSEVTFGIEAFSFAPWDPH